MVILSTQVIDNWLRTDIDPCEKSWPFLKQDLLKYYSLCEEYFSHAPLEILQILE